MSENQVPGQTFSPADRPGRRLAEARKALGLSIEDVANRLRLNISILQALENDDYSRLPPAAFVSGYLRAYARILGLSEAEVSRGTLLAGSESRVDTLTRRHPTEVRASDPPMRIISYIIIGGLVLLSSVWWLAQPDEVPSYAPQETPAANHEAATPPTDDPAMEANPQEPAESALATTDATVPVSPLDETPVTGDAAPVVPAPETKPELVVPSRPQAPQPPPLTPEMRQAKLTLETTADCWLDVVDAAGRQLAYAVSPAGRKVVLRGEAPFKVFFGYSPGVQVYLNDQLFDHRPFQRRETARFRLGTAEDNELPTEAR